jgi:hypothetical protein
MIKECPEIVGGVKVVMYTPIDYRHRFTGKCKQVVAGKMMGQMAGLAICGLENDTSFYLFGCTPDWTVVTDTLHATVEDAMDQAEFEYEGVTRTWIRK